LCRVKKKEKISLTERVLGLAGEVCKSSKRAPRGRIWIYLAKALATYPLHGIGGDSVIQEKKGRGDFYDICKEGGGGLFWG